MAKTIVISGGTDGMGRAFSLARAALGDTVIALGSDPAKGEALARAARVHFLPADLSVVSENERVIAEIETAHDTVDALLLFANRVSARRVTTIDGFERTFALYYLSRYLLSHRLTPLLRRAERPVIVNIGGVGVRKGAIDWTDPQLADGYSAVRAQLQAGRANDLLGVAYAESGGVPYVLYHPGFTRSGDLSQLKPLVRWMIRGLARLSAQPVAAAIEPLHAFVDYSSTAPLRAVDRGRDLELSLPTLDPGDAHRLADLTANLLRPTGPRPAPDASR
ncbi:SDR family NAD(P)-dependent oxidoreductase [Nocardia sp. NBC_00511]|uniref:SDR family NAD(P)-dependent oxidoreductase n=1 Tax=Nocardia sp. NBC_00511 TaxID=2903591 RepID=UPI0030DEEAB4